MTILSSHFFIFIFFSLVFYYFVPEKFQYLVLLISSLLFYLFISPLYTILLIILTLSDFIFAKNLSHPENKGGRKKILLYGIAPNLLFLLFFKFYYPLEKILAPLIPSLNLWNMKFFVEITVPLGISYYVFKKISYISDVYRGIIPPEKNFFRLLLYVSFFPEIAAGPIDRAKDLLSQFSQYVRFNHLSIAAGFQRILWGIFKKVVIADRAAIFTDMMFRDFRTYDSLTVVFGLSLYSVQIYCDFSAIADIAIGIGKMFGIKLAENFKRPWLSISIRDFWQRWHITLSKWLRDYLFLPIAYFFSRKKFIKNLDIKTGDKYIYTISAILTMVICGIWHGTGWTFLIWGLIHGIFLGFSKLSERMRKKIRKTVRLKNDSLILKGFRIIFTFSLITFSWIFFRAESISHSIGMINQIFLNDSALKGIADLYNRVLKDFPPYTAEILIAAILIMVISETMSGLFEIGDKILRKPLILRILFYYFSIISILVFAVKASGDFIYMQF